MARLATCLLVVALALCSANAQEDDFSAQLVKAQQENGQLRVRITGLEAELAAARAQTTTATDAQRRVQDALDAATSKEAQLSTAIRAAEADAAASKQRLAQVQSDLATEKQALQAALSELTELRSAQDKTLDKVVMEALDKNMAALKQATLKAVETAKRDYLPMVESQLAVVQKEWREHVTESTWAATVKSQLALVEAELRTVLATHGSKVPGLSNVLADPVVEQLVIYCIMALPLALLALPLIALCCRAPAAASGDAQNKNKKKQKQKK